MAVYRSYIAACKMMSEKVQVTEEASKVMIVITTRYAAQPLMHTQHIQDDFVHRRQQDKSMTPDELIHLMKVARSAPSPS